MQLLVLIAVFLGVASLIIALYLYINRRKLAIMDLARSRLETAEGPAAAIILKDEESASALPLLNRIISGRELTDRLALQLKRADVAMTPGAFMLTVALGGAAGMMFGSRLSFVGLLAGGAIGFGLPLLWLSRVQQKRLAAFEEQLPDAIDMLVSALKSGYSFLAATNFLGQELAEPLGPEFSRMYDEQRLGIDGRTALLNFQDRISTVDIRMFVTALLIQRETGGSLSDVLSNTATLIRERIVVRGHLQTLTAEAKYSGRILALLPVGVFLGLSFVVPDFTKTFVDTTIGQFMLFGASLSVAFGYMIMMKIADVDF
jgi:tight adherence protein B